MKESVMVMRVGLLWFDDDPQRVIEEKVRRAAKRYREKFGRAANTCYVNPVSLEGNGHSKEGFRCGRVTVLANAKILPHHFYVGVADRSQEEKEGKELQ